MKRPWFPDESVPFFNAPTPNRKDVWSAVENVWLHCDAEFPNLLSHDLSTIRKVVSGGECDFVGGR